MSKSTTRHEAFSDRLERSTALALLLVALFLRIGFVLTLKPGFYFEDSLDYDRAARSLLQTGHFDAGYYRFPLYPVLLATSYRLFGGSLLPFRILQAILGTLTCAVVWRLSRAQFGRRTGLIALLGLAVFPPHILLSGVEYPTLAGMLATWLALWMLWKVRQADEARGSCIALLSLCVGLACLTFPAGFALALFVLIWLVFRRQAFKEKARDLFHLALASSILLAPWLVSMVRAGDYRPLVLKLALHLPVPYGAPLPVWEHSGTNLLEAKLAWLRAHPGWILRHARDEFFHFWNPTPDRLHSADASFRDSLHSKDPRMETENPFISGTAQRLYALTYASLLVTAALGALAGCLEIEGLTILIGWPIVLALCYSLIFTKTRYRMPADPSFLILAGYVLALATAGTLGNRLLALPRTLGRGGSILLKKAGLFQPSTAD